MKKLINKKVLSETLLYHGDIKLPLDWKIDRDQLLLHEVYANIKNQDFIPCKPYDILNLYIIEHLYVEQNLTIENKKYIKYYPKFGLKIQNITFQIF